MATATESHINAALAAVPGWDMRKFMRRKLDGGLLNSNWLVNHDGENFFVKIFGVGSENFVDRQLYFDAASKAHGLDISPGIVFFDEGLGIEVFRFLEGYRSSTHADFARRDFMAGAIDLYRQFNSCAPLPVTKDVFAMTDEHIAQGDEIGAIRPADYDWLLRQYGRAKQAFLASGLDLAPCHNDPMPGNFMVRMLPDPDRAGAGLPACGRDCGRHAEGARRRILSDLRGDHPLAPLRRGMHEGERRRGLSRARHLPGHRRLSDAFR